MKIYDAITNINDDILEEALEPVIISKKFGFKQISILVASLSLVFVGLISQSYMFNDSATVCPPPPSSTASGGGMTSGTNDASTNKSEDLSVTKDHLKFNEIYERVTYDMAFPEGYFQVEINENQIINAFPKLGNLTEFTDITGYIEYSSQEEITEFWRGKILLEIDDIKATIEFSEESIPKCVILESDFPIKSKIDGVWVTASKSNSFYFADFMIDNIEYNVQMTSPTENDDIFTDLIIDIIQSDKSNP